MKLFTSAIDKQLFSQYSKGNDLSSQKVVAKIFNPYGRGTWYLINSDPSDPDYIWAIVDLFEVEVGSVSRSELENVKVPPFRLPLERDLSFTPMNAEELLNGLMQGNRYAKGGVTKYQNDIEVIEARDGSNFLFPESNDPKNVGILLADGGCMAEGGEIKWQDAYRGDNALVIAENKLGVIVKPYGRKFHLRFPDGSEKTYDASELKFIKDEDEYAKGGKTVSEDVVYIQYRNAKKGFSIDKKYFRGEDAYKEAVKWGRKNIDNFNIDMVKFEMAMGGKLDVGRYYKTKDGRQVRYLGNTKDPELGTFMNKADGVFKVRYDEIEGNASLFAEGGEMENGGKIELFNNEDLIKLLKSINFKTFKSSDISEINYRYYGTYNIFDDNFYAKIYADPCIIIIKKSDDGYNIYIGKKSIWQSGLTFEQTEYSFKIKNLTFKDFEEGLKNAVKNNLVTLYSNYASGSSLNKIYYYGSEEDAEKFALEKGYKKVSDEKEGHAFSYYYFNPNLSKYNNERFLFVHRFSYDDVKEIGLSKLTDSSEVMAEGGEMKKGGITGDLHSLTDELLAQKIKIFIDKIKPIKYYYIDEDSNSLIIGLDENYTQDSGDKLYKEATSSMEFFDADSVDMRYIPHKKQTEYSIKLKKVAKFAKGGEMEEGVDLFQDYENIPAKVQKVLDENSVAFEDGDYRDLEKAVKELEKIGYTFEYDLDGQAYDLRKIGQKGKSEVGDDNYAEGGEVGGITADEAIYLYIKKAINQPYREKYLKPAGLWNTPKMKEVEQSLKKKGYLNGAGAINETGKNKAREVDASVDMIISRRYISSNNTKATYLEILEKFQGNDKMAMGGYMAKGGEVGVRYFIGKPEVDKVGRFGKKRASWKTCLVNERGEKNYSEYTTSFVGSLSDVKLDGIKISQSEFDKLNFDKKMAMGGEVKFADKVKSIKSSLLKRKKVSPKVQKDYGKTYSPKEAEESAKRIVGAMRKKMMGESK